MGGSAPGREALIWQTAVVLQGSRVSSAVSIRCLDTSAPVPVEVQRPAGTGGQAPTSSPADRTQTPVEVHSDQCLRCLRADRSRPPRGADRGQRRSGVALWAPREVRGYAEGNPHHEGDDPHRLATTGAQEREDFLDPSEQHRPEAAGGGRRRSSKSARA